MPSTAAEAPLFATPPSFPQSGMARHTICDRCGADPEPPPRARVLSWPSPSYPLSLAHPSHRLSPHHHLNRANPPPPLSLLRFPFTSPFRLFIPLSHPPFASAFPFSLSPFASSFPPHPSASPPPPPSLLFPRARSFVSQAAHARAAIEYPGIEGDKPRALIAAEIRPPRTGEKALWRMGLSLPPLSRSFLRQRTRIQPSDIQAANAHKGVE